MIHYEREIIQKGKLQTNKLAENTVVIYYRLSLMDITILLSFRFQQIHLDNSRDVKTDLIILIDYTNWFLVEFVNRKWCSEKNLTWKWRCDLTESSECCRVSSTVFVFADVNWMSFLMRNKLLQLQLCHWMKLIQLSGRITCNYFPKLRKSKM